MSRAAPAVLLLLAAVATTAVLGARLPPRLSSSQSNISLREGQTRFVLECNLDVGDDPISYRWLKNHQIVTGALGYAYRGYRKVFLALHMVEQQHAGTYVCEASNDAGAHSAAIKVTVDSWGSSATSEEELPHTDETLSDIATSLSDVLAEGECKCHSLFLIHASTDSPPETIAAQANLVHIIADQIISDTNRVSVMTYSDYTHTKLSFRNGSNQCALRDAFRDLSHDKWATRLEPVLREIFKKFRKSKASCKILFLPIFGSLGTEGADILGSQHLQKVGVKVFILEVTPTPLEGVREMASQRGDGFPYHWRVPLQIWPTIVMNMKYMAEEVEGCMSQEEDVAGVCVGEGGSCTDDTMCRGIGFGCTNGQCVFKDCNVNPAQPGCCREESPTRQFWCGDVTGQCTSANSMCNGRIQCMNGADEGPCWSIPCPQDKIARCHTSTLCLDLMDLCNGEPACPGEEDEDPRFCRSFPCPIDRPFRCRNGKCIAKESLCDGVFKDCAEGEDELLEFCKSVHVCPANRPFKCDYGICVPERVVCDGSYNCLDATDELVCEANNCPAERPFKCLNSLCISMDQVCNGVVDGCTDGSDEQNCTQIECPPNRNFKCTNGRCIDGWLRCNDDDDCGDGTDELNCQTTTTTTAATTTTTLPPQSSPRACSHYEFTCDNGACISNIRVCDGRDHCLNGEDELDCEDLPCPSNRPHRCKDGTCVVSAVPCNHIKECGDGSDEINCAHVEPEPEPESEPEHSEEVTEEPAAPPPRRTTPATTTTTTTEKRRPKETADEETQPDWEHETALEEDTHAEESLEDESDAVETMLEETEPEEVRPAASSEQGVGGGSNACTAPTCVLVVAPLLVVTLRNVWTR